MLYPAQMSVNVEMPAAGSDSPCLAVEKMWRTSPTYFVRFLEWSFFWGNSTPILCVLSRFFFYIYKRIIWTGNMDYSIIIYKSNFRGIKSGGISICSYSYSDRTGLCN